MKRLIVRFLAVLGCALALPATAQVSVLTYHNDNSRTGQNLDETTLTPANVRPASFGKLFTYAVDGYVYAQPLYVSGLSVPGSGKHNVIFVATEHNSVYAFDADTNGTGGGLLWQVNLGTSGLSASGDFGTHYGSYSDITPEVGITGTPVIDPGSKTLYVDAFTHEGGSYVHKIHALDITTGAEKSFSPVVVTASVPGVGRDADTNGVVTFNPRQELQRCALTLANGILYVAYGGYADTDPYHGWVIGFNASTLQQLPDYVFNTTPNSTIADFGNEAGEGGIWMSGCGLSADSGGNLYLGVGNGSFDAFNNSNGTEFGDSFLKLSTSHGLSVADYFTPYNQQFLADNNLDLGSTGILLLPNQPGANPHLMLGGGKSGTMYLMNRDMLAAGNNHYNTNGSFDAVVQTITLGGPGFNTPAYFNGTIYFAAVRDTLRAYSLTNGLLPDVPTAVGPRQYNYPGATPSVSANGSKDGIVWTVKTGNPAVLIAHDANNVSTEIYSSDTTAGRDDLPPGVKFAVPTVANGKVYVGGQYALTVFGILDTGGGTNSGGGGDWQPIAANYSGLFYESGNVPPGSSGSFSATTTSAGTFTGQLQMGKGRYPFRGQFDSTGAANVNVPRKGNSALTLTLQMNTLDNSRIGGTISDGSWSADLAAYRNAGSSPFAGRYTLVFPSADNSHGDGYGAAIVNSAGQVKFTGALGDGTKLSQSAVVSLDGQWPFYSPLKSGGEIIGWLGITNGNIGGQLDWNSTSIDVTGSTYQPSASPLSFQDGTITLSGGGLDSDLTSDVSIFGTRGMGQSGNPVKLTITPTTGLFKGTMVNPATGRTLKFSGAILQNQESGSGYFLNAGDDGHVSFGPAP